MNEERLQAELFKWVWNSYPKLRRHLWAVPNGGYRNAREAAALKANGVLAGVWDLHFFYKNKFHIIETKIGQNKLTVDRVENGVVKYGQKQWGEIMVANGATAHVYYTLEEGKGIFKKIVESFL